MTLSKQLQKISHEWMNKYNKLPGYKACLSVQRRSESSCSSERVFVFVHHADICKKKNIYIHIKINQNYASIQTVLYEQGEGATQCALGLKPRMRTTPRRGGNENCMIVIKEGLSRGAEVIQSEVTIISGVQSLYFVCVFCVTYHATTPFLSVCTWKHNPLSLPPPHHSLFFSLLSNTFTAFFHELICFHLPYVSRRNVLVLTACALGSLGHKSVSTS